MRRAFALLLALLFCAPAHAQRSDAIARAASTYIAFQLDVGALGHVQLAGAEELDVALDRASRYDARVLNRGWMAYGALMAAKSPAFQAGMRSVILRNGRGAVLRALRADPYYTARRRGFADAVLLIARAGLFDGRRVTRAADRLSALSYDLQGVAWAEAVEDPAPRLARLRARAAAGLVSDPVVVSAFAAFVAASPPVNSSYFDAPAAGSTRIALAPTRLDAARAMAQLAGLSILGSDAGAEAFLRDERGEACFTLAQLQYHQCLSVVHGRYETLACAGQHALRDVGQCIGAFADSR